MIKFNDLFRMPGTKIELKGGDDPDPAPFLFVSAEIKKKISEKAYDPKRSCYVPHAEEKFAEGMTLLEHKTLT